MPFAIDNWVKPFLHYSFHEGSHSHIFNGFRSSFSFSTVLDNR